MRQRHRRKLFRQVSKSASQSPSKENTKGFEHLVSKIQRVLTSGKENTKDFDPWAVPDPKIKVRGDDFDATVLQG